MGAEREELPFIAGNNGTAPWKTVWQFLTYKTLLLDDPEIALLIST